MKYYKLVQSNIDDSYKIHITTKWFGCTVWTSFYCQETEYGCFDVSWVSKKHAQKRIDLLEEVEIFHEVEN